MAKRSIGARTPTIVRKRKRIVLTVSIEREGNENKKEISPGKR